MESLWELVPAGGRQRLGQFKPKLVEPMLEPPQGLVGKEQNDSGECLEEDKCKGVPGREEAHADEKVQAKEGGNVGMKSHEVLAGQRLGWRVANARPCCCSGGVSVLCHLLRPDGLHISSTLGLALLGAINSSLNDPKQVQNTPEKRIWLVFSCLAGPSMGSMVDRSEWGEQAGHRLQLLAALPCGSA